MYGLESLLAVSSCSAGPNVRLQTAYTSLDQQQLNLTSCLLLPVLQCCLPAGIDIVLHQDLDKADLTPHTYTIVLTGQQQRHGLLAAACSC